MIFKTLLKKELMSFAGGFINKKKSAAQSPAGAIVGFCLVLGLLMGVLGMAFFTIFSLLAPSMIEKNELGLYFGFAALGAFGLSIIGSVAAVKSKLYEAKDNDALLSMPIPPRYILLCRIIPVYLENLLFQLTFFIPALIAYYLHASVGVSLIYQILIIPVFSLLATSITCLIGRLLAFLMSKVKHKSLITMIFFVLFFIGYFLLMSSNSDFVILLIENVEKIKPVFKGALWLFYQVGLGMSGRALQFILTFLICAIVFGLIFYRLSKTYIKTVTHTGKVKNTAKKEESFSQSSALKTLLYKEWKRFSSSPLYMMNSGMGCIFAVLAGCAMLFSNDVAAELLSPDMPKEIGTIIPFFIIIVMAAMSGMNTVSAPSVSLEGKNMWILKTLPVSASKVVQAKLLFHVFVSAPFSLFAGIATAISFKVSFLYAIISIACGLLIIPVQGFLGLLFDVKKPNLSWNTEAEPIKQSFAVFLSMLLNILLSLAVSAAGIFLSIYTHPALGFLAIVILLAVANLSCYKWTKGRGAKLFNKIVL